MARLFKSISGTLGEVDGEAVISLSSKDIQVDSVKVYGPLLIFHSIAKKIKLPEILGKYSNEILSMVYAHCMDYKSIRNMPRVRKRSKLDSQLRKINTKSISLGDGQHK